MKTIKKASPSLDWAIRRATSTWDDLMNAGKDGADSDTLKKKKGALAKAMAELQYIYSMSEDVQVEYREEGFQLVEISVTKDAPMGEVAVKTKHEMRVDALLRIGLIQKGESFVWSNVDRYAEVPFHDILYKNDDEFDRIVDKVQKYIEENGGAAANGTHRKVTVSGPI